MLGDEIENLHHFVVQSDTKPIGTPLHMFSHDLPKLHVIASSFDWFTRLSGLTNSPFIILFYKQSKQNENLCIPFDLRKLTFSAKVSLTCKHKHQFWKFFEHLTKYSVHRKKSNCNRLHPLEERWPLWKSR